MSDQPLGPILDELGVTVDLHEHDRITEVMVIAKVTDLSNGDVGITVSTSGLDWVAQAGLHACVGRVLDAPVRDGDDE